MMTIQEQRRKAFQGWWQADAQSELRASCAQGWGEYIWNAALDSVEIELPKESAVDGLMLISQAREVIEAAGLKVKP